MRLTLLALGLSVPALAFQIPQGAPGSNNPTDLKSLTLEQLSQIQVTTPTKEPQQAFRSPVAIYVIRGDDIRRSGATSIPEALRLAPGVEVARIDAGRWSIGIRGFGTRLTRSVLVLIDGREVYTKPVDLKLAILKAEENLSLVIGETGTKIKLGDLPVLVGFESHFVPLFQNIIGNAIKYRSDEPPVIKIQCHRNGTQLEIAVSDNGIGIAPEYHAKIFVAFKRLHNNKIPGTGIGLAICQRMSKNMVVESGSSRTWAREQLFL